MSYGVYVVPTVPVQYTWGNLKALWRELLLPRSDEIFGGSLWVKDYETGAEMEDAVSVTDGLSEKPDGERICEFSTSGILLFTKTTSLSPYKDGERKFIERYRNKDQAFLETVWQGWKASGIMFNAESYTGQGRSKYEKSLLVTLAAAIGKLCDGYIAFNREFDLELPIGLYSPDEFLAARPKQP